MSRPPRLAHFDYRGPNRYFLTFCTRNRQETFRDVAIASMVAAQLRRTARQMGFVVLAYCVMPDHVHTLVEGTTADAAMRRFVKTLKQRTGQRYAHRAGALLWQERYYDRVLRRDEDSQAVARYILTNPLRAGLVVSIPDYPHLGSDRWTITELMESVE